MRCYKVSAYFWPHSVHFSATVFFHALLQSAEILCCVQIWTTVYPLHYWFSYIFLYRVIYFKYKAHNPHSK